MILTSMRYEASYITSPIRSMNLRPKYFAVVSQHPRLQIWRGSFNAGTRCAWPSHLSALGKLDIPASSQHRLIIRRGWPDGQLAEAVLEVRPPCAYPLRLLAIELTAHVRNRQQIEDQRLMVQQLWR